MKKSKPLWAVGAQFCAHQNMKAWNILLYGKKKGPKHWAEVNKDLKKQLSECHSEAEPYGA